MNLNIVKRKIKNIQIFKFFWANYKSLKAFIVFFINKNILNKQFIPDIYNNINIETSSRCNLGCKFCAYPKRDLGAHPRQIMSTESFEKIIKDVKKIGYKNIGLTPATGDIFMDKKIFEKISLIEKYDFNGFYFYTNFIPISIEQIKKLIISPKLKFLGISIYGHSLDTFKKFTNSNDVSFKKLIENLNYLYELLSVSKIDFKLQIGQRSSKNFFIEKDNNELSLILKKLIKIKNTEYAFTEDFNNWGGIVNQSDVKDLNIDLNTKYVKKYGACALIFSRMIIGANGNVNACACRDANYTLSIGNVNENDLKNIISYKNKKYLDLITNQEQNKFNDVCKNCDFYTSIYTKFNENWFEVKENKKLTLEKFNKIMIERNF